MTHSDSSEGTERGMFQTMQAIVKHRPEKMVKLRYVSSEKITMAQIRNKLNNDAYQPKM